VPPQQCSRASEAPCKAEPNPGSSLTRCLSLFVHGGVHQPLAHGFQPDCICENETTWVLCRHNLTARSTTAAAASQTCSTEAFPVIPGAQVEPLAKTRVTTKAMHARHNVCGEVMTYKRSTMGYDIPPSDHQKLKAALAARHGLLHPIAFLPFQPLHMRQCCSPCQTRAHKISLISGSPAAPLPSPSTCTTTGQGLQQLPLLFNMSLL